MSKHNIKVSTPHGPVLHIEASVLVNEAGNLEIHGIPGVTYEMYDSELCLFAYSDTGELNYSGLPATWVLSLNDKPFGVGDEYFDFNKKELTLIKKTLTEDSKWEGEMFWTVEEAIEDIEGNPYHHKDMNNKIIHVYDDSEPELVRVTINQKPKR